MKNEMVLTRQMFCERCFKNNRSFLDMKFVVFGGTSQQFKLLTVERYIPAENKGFVPHLVALYKSLDADTIAFNRVCCVIGCGVVIRDNPQDRNKYLLEYKHVSYEQMSIKDWNILVMTKDFGYHI